MTSQRIDRPRRELTGDLVLGLGISVDAVVALAEGGWANLKGGEDVGEPI